MRVVKLNSLDTICMLALCIYVCSMFIGIFVAQCLYAARPNLALGVEGLFHRGMNPSIRQVATNVSASLVAKYTGTQISNIYCTIITDVILPGFVSR